MTVRVVRLGTDRAPDEGVCLGTVRRPPRGVKKEDYARLSHQADFAVGCYCENFSRCHRSILKELLIEHGAKIAASSD